jgi:hypothetical protein
VQANSSVGLFSSVAKVAAAEAIATLLQECRCLQASLCCLVVIQ